MKILLVYGAYTSNTASQILTSLTESVVVFEFGEEEYVKMDRYCKEKGITWFASCWDEASVDFIEQFSPACYKILSAPLINDRLLRSINTKGRPVILSTGMSTMEEIRHAVELLDRDNLIIAHRTSSYSCKPEKLNLCMIQRLR